MTLINDLIEFSQRCDLVPIEKGKMFLKYKEKGTERTAELLVCDGIGFLFKDNKVKKITTKVEDCEMEEVNDAIEKQRKEKEVQINPKIFELLKKELGNYEITV